MAKHKVVEAAGAAGGSTSEGYTARELEQVMSEAITMMMEAGEQDPDKIRAAMLDAKQQFIDKRRAEVAAAAEAGG